MDTILTVIVVGGAFALLIRRVVGVYRQAIRPEGPDCSSACSECIDAEIHGDICACNVTPSDSTIPPHEGQSDPELKHQPGHGARWKGGFDV